LARPVRGAQARRGHLETYGHTFGATIAEDSYSQSAAPCSPGAMTEHRWVDLRDVFDVDGKDVRDHSAHLQALLNAPGYNPLVVARRIADESARTTSASPGTSTYPPWR
jgi:hypothetical protein